MTRKERVIQSFLHHSTDIIPYHIDLTDQAEKKLAVYTGKSDYLAGTGIHLHGFQYWGWPTETEPGNEKFRDDFGVVWNRRGADKDIGVVENYLISESETGLRPEPYFNEARLRRELEETIKTSGDKFVYAGIGFSVFERLWSYCGMENALVYMLTDPDFTHDLLGEITEYNLKIIDILNQYPIDAVYFGDDWGQQKGLIMGPELWRKFIRPCIAVMYERAKKGGKFIIQHSCGDIRDIFPDLIDIGLDCYQTFQPEIYDVAKMKREYGDYISFWGGISTQRLLPFALPEKVKEETKRLMDCLSINGGYIAAPTHAVPADVPPENILAMLEVFENQ